MQKAQRMNFYEFSFGYALSIYNFDPFSHKITVNMFGRKKYLINLI
jgi:hypothetical protein